MKNIAFVGTGFVADYYMKTLQNHANMRLVGVWDKDPVRLAQFSGYYQVKTFDSLNALLSDKSVDIIVNLTNPESHFEINMAALHAGKHVYCEKPLALTYGEAKDVIDYANAHNLSVCAAPANALSDAFDVFKAELDKGDIGAPKLAYIEMEDGAVFRDNWPKWTSESGAPWPGVHEFQIGCTLEHAGYGLSWLVRLFGPIKSVRTFSHLAFPDKGFGTQEMTLAADFSVGCLTFENGMVARITCGLAAPRDRSFTLLCEKGHLIVQDLWDHHSSIYVSKPGAERSFFHKLHDKFERKIGKSLPFNLTMGRKLSYDKTDKTCHLPKYPSQIDFAKGIAEQALALDQQRTPFFSGQVALHLTEVALALSYGDQDQEIVSRF